jgi:hypothetical protein
MTPHTPSTATRGPTFGPAYGAWLIGCIISDPALPEIERERLAEVRQRIKRESERKT